MAVDDWPLEHCDSVGSICEHCPLFWLEIRSVHMHDLNRQMHVTII